MVALLKNPARVSEDKWADRRMFPRKELHATVQGKRIDHTIEARQNPRLNITLRDLSFGGMSAVVDRPLGKGERINVVFPAQGWMRRLGRLRPNPPLRPHGRGLPGGG